MLNPNAQQPLLAYSWRWSRVSDDEGLPGSVYDTLHLYPDGSVWFWSPISQVNARDHAGTYSFTLPADELEDARDLAERLAALPPFEGQPARDAPDMQVVATVDGKSRPHLLSQEAGSRVPPEWKEALNLGGSLRKRAEDSPLAAVQLSWEPVVQGLVSRQPGHLYLNLKNTGSEPVRLTIDPNSLAFQAKGAEGRIDESLAHAPQDQRATLGLQDEKGDLLGGLFAPAEIKPGRTAQAFFMNAYTPPGPGKLDLTVSIGGDIALLYPQGNPLDKSDLPTTPFKVQTDPTPVQVL